MVPLTVRQEENVGGAGCLWVKISAGQSVITRRLLAWTGIVLLVLAAAFVADHLRLAMARDVVPWRDASVTQVVNNAARPTLIRFTSDTCPACYAMKAQVFSDEALAADVAARFVPVSVNLDHAAEVERELAERYRVAVVPTFVIVDPAGNELARLEGFADLPAFRAWLDTAQPRPPRS